MARWQAFLEFDTTIQAHPSVHTIHPLVIPLKTLPAQPVHHLVEAPASMLLSQRCELLNHLRVIWPPRLIAIGASTQSTRGCYALFEGENWFLTLS
jgi:hypothetical protein